MTHSNSPSDPPVPGVRNDRTSETQEPVTPFPVKVLGGSFHVHELVVPQDRTASDVASAIRSMAPDRWFVMVSDHRTAHQDALALIDDELEFQIYAHGTLVQD